MERRILSRLRRLLERGILRLRVNGWPVIQTAAAASISYFIATYILGNTQAFFAPVAAVVSLGITLGQRGRRAVELTLGVAVGLVVADLLVLAIGVGAAQIGVVVALAMVAAMFFGERNILVNQAAISAILVVVLQPPQSGFTPSRLVDALVGGAVALAIHYLLPVDPERMVERRAHPIFDELVSVLREIATALAEGDRERAEKALTRSRWLDDQIRGLDEALAAGSDTARLSPTRRRALHHLRLYATAATRIELAVINTRVLARGATNALRRGDEIPPLLPDAVLDLAQSVRALEHFLDEPGPPDEARRYALEAATKATRILKERHNLAISVLVGQIRSSAVDLLRSTGMNQEEALRALEEAAGRASEVG
ncbi:FUSC family protein [Rubrobacter calidifluminis]|uniref:FUSC family protein n=1 Tax=Rubrobacter calidifluminis TaxID=1392640 RepID=UPI003B5C6054